MSIARTGSVCLLALGLAGPARSATTNLQLSAATPAAMRAHFESELASLSARYEAAREEHLAGYREQLARMEDALAANGALRETVALHDERARLKKSGTLPDTVMTDVPDLRVAQEACLLQLGEDRLAYAEEVVALGQKYLRHLALVQQALSVRRDTNGVALALAERDRLLAHRAVRDALKEVYVASASADYTYATPGAVGDDSLSDASEDADVTSKAVKLHALRGEDPAVALSYEIDLVVLSSSEQLRRRASRSLGQMTVTESGKERHYPRVTLRCRTQDIPAGSRLVVEYYSQSLAESDKQRECVEHIPLPGVAAGDSVVVEGKGVALYRFMQRRPGKDGPYLTTEEGWDLFGVILSLYTPEDELLIQRFAPQSLSREVETEMQPPVRCPG